MDTSICYDGFLHLFLPTSFVYRDVLLAAIRIFLLEKISFRPTSAFTWLTVRFTIPSILPPTLVQLSSLNVAISISCTSSVKWTRSDRVELFSYTKSNTWSYRYFLFILLVFHCCISIIHFLNKSASHLLPHCFQSILG